MSTSRAAYAAHLSDVPETAVAPGIRRRDFLTTDQLRGWLLTFEPGSEWPEVDEHTAEERYFVLEGEIVEDDVRYPAGTYVVFAAGSRHRPRTDAGAVLLGTNVVA